MTFVTPAPVPNDTTRANIGSDPVFINKARVRKPIFADKDNIIKFGESFQIAVDKFNSEQATQDNKFNIATGRIPPIPILREGDPNRVVIRSDELVESTGQEPTIVGNVVTFQPPEIFPEAVLKTAEHIHTIDHHRLPDKAPSPCPGAKPLPDGSCPGGAIFTPDININLPEFGFKTFSVGSGGTQSNQVGVATAGATGIFAIAIIAFLIFKGI